ncbi:hypothetical protein FHG87_022958 [Trinorchestia longiramus]|nr:hypothetical protein FHG87_022958 [Trinorchestia longiramus]
MSVVVKSQLIRDSRKKSEFAGREHLFFLSRTRHKLDINNNNNNNSNSDNNNNSSSNNNNNTNNNSNTNNNNSNNNNNTNNNSNTNNNNSNNNNNNSNNRNRNSHSYKITVTTTTTEVVLRRTTIFTKLGMHTATDEPPSTRTHNTNKNLSSVVFDTPSCDHNSYTNSSTHQSKII